MIRNLFQIEEIYFKLLLLLKVLGVLNNGYVTVFPAPLQPQNSMPDVIIWMISGEKRIAYYRIPAHTLLFSQNPLYCGRECGKIQSIQMKVN